MKRTVSFFATVTIMILVGGCNIFSRDVVGGISPTATLATTQTLFTMPATWTPTLQSSPNPTQQGMILVTPSLPRPTETLTLSSTDLSIPSIQPTFIITPGMLVDPQNDLAHDWIIFSSLNMDAIPSLRDKQSFNDYGDILQFQTPQLWAISIDGKMVGRLTEPGMAFGLYIPSTPEEKALAANYSISLNNDFVQPVKLPLECFTELRHNDDLPNLLPCENFIFSPDGQYLAFFYGEEICGRGLMVMAVATGDIVFRLSSHVHNFSFLPGRAALLITETACEVSSVSLVDLLAGTEIPLGPGLGWMHSDTSIMGYSQDYNGGGTSIWGYDLTSESYFISIGGILGPSLWSPDNSAFIYQSWDIITSTMNTVTFGTSQILRVDMESHNTDVLLGDKDNDYYLCDIEEEGIIQHCDWYGDWIIVRRFKSQERIIIWEDVGLGDICFSYGKDCAGSELRFALNFRTGEIVAWDEFQPPQPTATLQITSTPIPEPDLSKKPIYVHPMGYYAFYVGKDGQSLWLVSPNNEPVMWVDDGRDFFYLP